MSYSQVYHWREAARFALVPWHVFRRLDVDDQAAIIAHYETDRRIAAVEAEQQRREAERRRTAAEQRQRTPRGIRRRR